MDYFGVIAKMSPGSAPSPSLQAYALSVDTGVVVSSWRGRSSHRSRLGKYRMAINNFVAAGGDRCPKWWGTRATWTPALWMRMYCAASSPRAAPLKAADCQPGDQVVPAARCLRSPVTAGRNSTCGTRARALGGRSCRPAHDHRRLRAVSDDRRPAQITRPNWKSRTRRFAIRSRKQKAPPSDLPLCFPTYRWP